MNWEKRQKFSIRKFAVGAASVVIGQFFVGQNLGDQAVSADEVATLVDESSSADTGQSPAQPSSVSVSEATEASVVETAPAATSAGESTGNKEVSAAHAETATSASTEAVVGVAERAATPAVSNTGAQEATTPAASNTGAQEATKDLTQAETVRYKVSYVDENGQVIYTTVKEAIIQAGQESVTVTEDGRELANEAALANYGTHWCALRLLRVVVRQRSSIRLRHLLILRLRPILVAVKPASTTPSSTRTSRRMSKSIVRLSLTAR